MKKSIFIIFALSAFISRSQVPGGAVQFAQPSPASNHFYLNADLPVIIDQYPAFASGTPYFIDEWSNADIEAQSGEVYKNIRVRLNLIENTLQYITPEGRQLIATTPIKAVVIKDSASGNVYRFIYSFLLEGTKNTKAGWYLELILGQASFYKRISKTIIQPKNYSASETQPSVNTSEEYFIYTDSTLSSVKKIKDVPALLKTKSTELNTYINSNKLSGKSESVFIDVIKYYNSLF